MNEMIYYIAGYLVIASSITYFVFKKTKNITTRKRRFIRSGIVAALFGPAIFWRFPFAFPAPAILAMIASVEAIFTYEAVNFIIGSVLFAFVPFFIFWGVYYGVASLYARFSK